MQIKQSDLRIQPNHGKFNALLISCPVIAALLISVLLYEISLVKGLLLTVGFTGVILLFIYPELAVVLACSSGIFKEWLSTSVPVFASFDFTVAVFGLAFVSAFFHAVRTGSLFETPFHDSMVPLALFTGLLLLSTQYTLSPDYGTIKAVHFAIFNWALFLIPFFLISSENSGWKIVFFLILMAVPVSVYNLITLARGISGQNMLSAYRASFLGINPISFAGWVGAVNILVISILAEIKFNRWMYAALIPVFILSLSLFAANSRGPLASFLFTLFVIGLFKIRSLAKWRNLIIILLGIIFLVMVYSLLPEQLTSRYTDSFSSQYEQGVTPSYTVSTRIHAWKTAVSIAVSSFRNFMFGVGSGGFSHELYYQDITVYPHNIFLEVLCELGFLGLCLLLWHLGSLFFDAIKAMNSRLSAKQKPLVFGFLMASLFYLTAAQFSGDLKNNRILWFFLGSLVALVRVYRNQDAPQ